MKTRRIGKAPLQGWLCFLLLLVFSFRPLASLSRWLPRLDKNTREMSFSGIPLWKKQCGELCKSPTAP